MAPRRKKQSGRRVEGWKAKSWFQVFAPENFGKTYLGDTPSADPEKVMGRVMQTTLGEIIQDYSKQNTKMRFKVVEVGGDAAYTAFIGHEVTKDYLRALVKRRTSRIDSLVPVTTKDGKKLRVTTTCFTINRADASQAKAIRTMVTQMVIARAAELSYEDFAREMVLGDLSRVLFKDVKKIFPTRRVEVIKSKAI